MSILNSKLGKYQPEYALLKKNTKKVFSIRVSSYQPVHPFIVQAIGRNIIKLATLIAFFVLQYKQHFILFRKQKSFPYVKMIMFRFKYEYNHLTTYTISIYIYIISDVVIQFIDSTSYLGNRYLTYTNIY